MLGPLPPYRMAQVSSKFLDHSIPFSSARTDLPPHTISRDSVPPDVDGVGIGPLELNVADRRQGSGDVRNNRQPFLLMQDNISACEEKTERYVDDGSIAQRSHHAILQTVRVMSNVKRPLHSWGL
jgi:hypothetical protein